MYQPMILAPHNQNILKTNDEAIILMHYLYTYPDTKIRYHTSYMQLYIDLDASYLVSPKVKSRIARYVYLVDKYIDDLCIPNS